MKTFPIELPDNLWLALRRLALNKGFTLKQLILNLLDEAVNGAKE